MDKGDRELQLVWGLDIMGEAYESESVKCFRFLSVFYPEMSLAKRLKIANQYLVNKYNK